LFQFCFSFISDVTTALHIQCVCYPSPCAAAVVIFYLLIFLKLQQSVLSKISPKVFLLLFFGCNGASKLPRCNFNITLCRDGADVFRPVEHTWPHGCQSGTNHRIMVLLEPTSKIHTSRLFYSFFLFWHRVVD